MFGEMTVSDSTNGTEFPFELMSRSLPAALIAATGLLPAPAVPSEGTVTRSHALALVVGNDVNRYAPPAQTSRPPNGRDLTSLLMVSSP